MRAIPTLTAAAAAALLACTSAIALEPFKLYDDFSATPLDPARWSDGERNRAVKSGALNLMQRSWGLGDADSGAFSGAVAYTQTDASPPGVPIKHLGTRLDLSSCLSSPRIGGMVDARFDNISVNSSAAP